MRNYFYRLITYALTVLIGALTGYFAVKPIWLGEQFPAWFPGEALLTTIKVLQSYLGDWSKTGDGVLALATLIVCIPGVLIFGVLLGLILPRFKYQRVFIGSILIWPVYYWAANLLVINNLKNAERSLGRDEIASHFTAWKFGLEMTTMSIMYLLFFLSIFTVSRLVARIKAYNKLLNTDDHSVRPLA